MFGAYSKRIIVLFCVISVIFLCSCGRREAKSGRFLNEYPISIHAIISFDGRDYEADILIEGKNDLSIYFSSPDTLKNAVLKMENGECFLQYMGLDLPLADGGYSSDNGLLLIRHIFSLTASDFHGADTVKESGTKLCIEHYKTSLGDISVYFRADAAIPDKVYATLNGREISLIIVNE